MNLSIYFFQNVTDQCVLTKDFMALFPSLVPLPKVNTRCLKQTKKR